MLQILSDEETQEQTDSWKPVANEVHTKDGKIFMQIWHVGASSHPSILGGKLPLSPSGVNPNIKVYADGGFVDTYDKLIDYLGHEWKKKWGNPVMSLKD